MISREDLEGFIARLEAEGVHAREVGPDLWVLSANGDGPEVAVHYAPPVVVLRVKVMTLPKKLKKPDLYLHLRRFLVVIDQLDDGLPRLLARIFHHQCRQGIP